jgi:hypothetical protein
MLMLDSGPLILLASKGTRAPAETERIEERDPATGETRTVERITVTSKNTYHALSENPQAFGAGATVMVGAYSAQVRSVLQMIDFHLRLLRPGCDCDWEFS